MPKSKAIYVPVLVHQKLVFLYGGQLCDELATSLGCTLSSVRCK